MAIPEGYSLLARVGFVDRGNYSASATYLAGDVVYYNGSTWSALKDNLKGVTPTNGANWRYMARGFASEVLSAITAKDTSGLVGTAGASVGAQELMDAIADKVATKLLLKTDLVSQIVNDATKAASMAALYAVKQQLDQQNSDLASAKKDLGALSTAITAKVSKVDLEIGAITATMVNGVTAKSGYAAAYGRLCVINLVVTAIALQAGTYNLFQISKKPLSNIPVYIYDDVNQVACPGEITSSGYVKIATAGRTAGDIRVMGVFYAAQ